MDEKPRRIEPVVSLRIDGHAITPRQLDVLRAVYEEGSQNRAAIKIGISTPVLHRYLAQIEAKIGRRLLEATATGTKLNEEGEKIALEYEALDRRMHLGGATVVGGTIITEELLLSSLNKVDPQGRCELILSDDGRNMKDFRAGMMDLVLLDDPLDLYELEGVQFAEVAEDRLVHVDRGPRYARFLYGAQRIGFRHLEAEGIDFTIQRTYRSVPALLNSGLSFFINESLVARRGLKIRSATDPRKLAHKITAAYEDESKVGRLLNRLKKDACQDFDRFR
jgi:DNA-binding transcriptional LysR family regulator